MINTQKLVEIVHQTPEAKSLFKYLAGRERHRGDTDIARLMNHLNKEGAPVTKQTIEQVFNTIQEAGFGQMVGLNNKRKFKWGVNVVKVGRIVKSSLDGSFTAKPASIEESANTKVSTGITITVGNASVQVEGLEDAAALLKLINANLGV